jgi:hypothetical protein
MNDGMIQPQETLPPTTPEVAVQKEGASDLSIALIVLTVALLVGTVMHRSQIIYTVNDASRWDTVYYLVQHGTYEFLPLTKEQLPKWAIRPATASAPDPADPGSVPVLWTIDMIRVGNKLCSPKPPLFPTVLAGIAWVTQKVSGQTFHDNPLVIIRTCLIVAQILPLGICLLLLRRHIFAMTDSVFARNFSVAAACMGTFLTPWSLTLNNHVVAACTGMIALDAVLRIWYDGRRQWYWFVIAAFFGAFTATTELPAGLLAAAIMLAMLIKDAKRTLAFAVIAAAIPTAAYFYTNYLAVGTFKPAYTSKGTPGGFYDYPGSYWNDPRGVDALKGKESRGVYLANILFGHDGFFSLTPIFLVSLGGLAVELLPRGRRSLLALFVLAVTATVVAVYVKTTYDYGGGCQGFRWLFWVIPMWLIFLPVGVEHFARATGGRAALYVLLAISVFSVGFAMDHPWTTNWIRLLFHAAGWIDY